MIVMNPCGALRSIVLWLMLFALISVMGCSRQIDVPSEEAAAQSDQAPFREVGSNSIGASAPVPEDPSSKHSGLPFHDSQNLPAGTLISVRLDASISAGQPNSFEGSVDEPVVILGKTILPRGTLVSGRVEFASSSNVRPDRSYVRLALISIRLAGTDVPVQTASLFARQHNPEGASNPIIRLEKGHRLTFRLTEPVYSLLQTAQVSQ